MLLFIDNFDSFTYNLVQCFQLLGIKTQVVRNQAWPINEYLACKPHYLVIGPGPGTPSQAGFSKELIASFAGQIPILGICLGHQAIGELFGGSVVRATVPMHGKTSQIFHNNTGLFHEIPQGFKAARYHSLTVSRNHLPSCLEVTAWTEQGEIMGLRHRTMAIEGVQFHPESIATEKGLSLLRNFLDNLLVAQ